MRKIDSLDQLEAWEHYREFSQENLKSLDGEEPCYVSKDKVDFKIDGKPYSAHAFLAGKNAHLAVQSLKKQGVIFKEGLCRPDRKDLRITVLSDKLVKEAAKTVLKLHLGFKVVEPLEQQDLQTEAKSGPMEPQARRKKLDELRQLGTDIDRLLAALNK